MSNKKRLGPQDPLSWIRDTRGEKLVHYDMRVATPVEVRRSKIQVGEGSPMEVTVVIKGQKADRNISVEVRLKEK